MGLFSDFLQKGNAFQPGGTGSITSSLVENTNNLKKSFNDLAKTGNDIVSDREDAATTDMIAQINSIKDPETLAAANEQIASGAFDNNVDRAKLINATKSREAGIREDLIAKDNYDLKVIDMNDRDLLTKFTAQIKDPLNNDGSKNEEIMQEVNASGLSPKGLLNIQNLMETEKREDDAFSLQNRQDILAGKKVTFETDKIDDRESSEEFINSLSDTNTTNINNYFKDASEFINNGNEYLSVDGSGRIKAKEGATSDQVRAGVELEKRLRELYPFLGKKDLEKAFKKYVDENNINVEVAEQGYATITASEGRRTMLSADAQQKLASQTLSAQKNFDSAIVSAESEKATAYARAPVDDYVTAKQQNNDVPEGAVIVAMKKDANAAIEENKTGNNQLGDNIDSDREEITRITKMINDYNAKTFSFKDPDNKGKMKDQAIPSWIALDAYNKVGWGGLFKPGIFNDREDISQYKTEVQRLLQKHVDNMVHVKTREEADAKYNAEKLTIEQALINETTKADDTAQAISRVFRNAKAFP